MKIEISKLRPHSQNRFIYGHEDNSELVEKIKSTGYIKPILITKDRVIISGHRRVECCRILGIPKIECQVVTEDDPTKILELLMLENYYREKTTYQKMKESEVYLQIERQKSYQRMVSGVKPDTGTTTGRTTEIISKKIGMGETTLKKGEKVMDYIEDHPETDWFFENLMDESMDKSLELTTKPQEFIDKVIETLSGYTGKLVPRIREMEEEEQQSKLSLPPGQYGVIIIDFSDRFTNNLLLTDISSICEDDCLLLMWVRPHQVDFGLNISKHYGFRYCTCILWNKNTEKDISINGELLLISVKGSPKTNFKIFDGSPEKPNIIEKMIKEQYQGWSMVEILVGDGWKVW